MFLFDQHQGWQRAGGPVGAAAFGLVCCTLTLTLAGCVDPPSDYAPIEADVVVESDTDFDELWEMALRVLRRRGLTPERQDRRAGVITTKPITTQQWFEFWRHDAMGPYQWVESSMHTIQRLAVVRFKPQPDRNRYRVTVRVDVFRHSAPERQVTTPSSALMMYSEKLPTEEGELRHPNENLHWVRLGRDPRMESVLLRRILSHYPGGYEVVEEPYEPTDDDLVDEPTDEDEGDTDSDSGAEGPSTPKS